MTARWRAPGRVNLIGEHTDYNDGFALPFALGAGCTAAVTWLPDPIVEVTSVQRDDAVQLPLDDLTPGTGGWAAYAAGAVWVLRELGATVGGVRIAIDSDVPTGAGLSSSAALVCSVTTALDDLFGAGLSEPELLSASRRVENDYVGAPTGGMDQLASLRCTAGHALFCDMRSLEVEQVPFDVTAEGLAVLVIDTRTEHRHADGEYAQRREGCERAAAVIGVPALRDVGVDDLEAALRKLPADGDGAQLRRYVRHIVTEDDRVLQTAARLRAGDIRGIGELLTASHVSMRDDYRITTAELDVTVETLLAAGALGARMTGGGFGGCAIALIDTDRVDGAVAAVMREYATRGFADPGHFVVSPERGAHRV